MCGWSKLACFCTRGENHLFLVWVCKLTWILCGWSKLTWFQCAGSSFTWFQRSMKWIWLLSGWLHFSVVDRRWFGFCVAIENELFFASGSRVAGFLCRGIEIDLILECGSKLTWFQWWGRHPLIFMCVIEIDLVSNSGWNLTWFLCAGQNRLRFCVRAEN